MCLNTVLQSRMKIWVKLLQVITESLVLLLFRLSFERLLRQAALIH